jgi:hypothetical protein
MIKLRHCDETPDLVKPCSPAPAQAGQLQRRSSCLILVVSASWLLDWISSALLTPQFSLSLVPAGEFTLENNSFLAVRVILDSILRGIAVQRQQTDNGVATSTSVINAPARGKVHRLTDAEFMV